MLGPEWTEVPATRSPEVLRVIGVKAFADGALGSRGAQLTEPYDDAPTTGLAVQSDAEIAARADFAERHGLQLGVHAIGDRGVRRVLDLFESRARGDLEAFVRAGRWRIEHTQMVHPDDMGRVAGLCVAAQPIHFTADAPWAVQRLGERRLPWSHRIRTLIEAGAVVAFSSDYPIESGDPVDGVMVAVAGSPPEAVEWLREHERLALHPAFDGYWQRAAYLAFDEHDLGRLLPGFHADMVCLDRDPFVAGFERDDPPRVVAVIVGGELVIPES
jgi:hypothetical protein